MLIQPAFQRHTYFEGEVVLFENDVPVDDLDKGILLTANQASRVVGSVNAAVEIEASPRSFLRLPKRIDSRLVAENVPFDADDELCLWFDAGKYLNTDESFRVVSWLDLTANGNSLSENAWQVDSEKTSVFNSRCDQSAPLLFDSWDRNLWLLSR